MRNVENGQAIADKMQLAYEQEQRDIQAEFDAFQNYDSDSDGDATLLDDFTDDDCEYDSQGSSLSL